VEKDEQEKIVGGVRSDLFRSKGRRTQEKRERIMGRCGRKKRFYSIPEGEGPSTSSKERKEITWNRTRSRRALMRNGGLGALKAKRGQGASH